MSFEGGAQAPPFLLDGHEQVFLFPHNFLFAFTPLAALYRGQPFPPVVGEEWSRPEEGAMISKMLCRVAFSVLLCSLLVSPAFAGQPQRSTPPAQGFLSELLKGLEALFPSFLKSGPGMDPWGGSIMAPGESGAGMDPRGSQVTSTGMLGTVMASQE
jgi:hypothetical protein